MTDDVDVEENNSFDQSFLMINGNKQRENNSQVIEETDLSSIIQEKSNIEDAKDNKTSITIKKEKIERITTNKGTTEIQIDNISESENSIDKISSQGSSDGSTPEFVELIKLITGVVKRKLKENFEIEQDLSVYNQYIYDQVYYISF